MLTMEMERTTCRPLPEIIDRWSREGMSAAICWHVTINLVDEIREEGSEG